VDRRPFGSVLRALAPTGQADHSEEDRMETQIEVIVRRLAAVPPVRGPDKVGMLTRSAGPGVSYYQKRSASLRTRDCSITLSGHDAFAVDLTQG